MAPHYHSTDDKRRRSVVLFDDRYVRKGTPQERHERKSAELVDALANKLVKRDLIVLARDILPTAPGLVVAHTGTWRHSFPAPSAWIIDIEIPIGGETLDGVCDGVGLACYIRAFERIGVQRPAEDGILTPVPIIFLTHFRPNDTLPDERDPSTKLNFWLRITDSVITNWSFFRKGLAAEGPHHVWKHTSPTGTPARYNLDELADEIRRDAYGV